MVRLRARLVDARSAARAAGELVARDGGCRRSAGRDGPAPRGPGARAAAICHAAVAGAARKHRRPASALLEGALRPVGRGRNGGDERRLHAGRRAPAATAEQRGRDCGREYRHLRALHGLESRCRALRPVERESRDGPLRDGRSVDAGRPHGADGLGELHLAGRGRRHRGRRSRLRQRRLGDAELQRADRRVRRRPAARVAAVEQCSGRQPS